MIQTRSVQLLLATLVAVSTTSAQTAPQTPSQPAAAPAPNRSGPVIKSGGATYDVPRIDFATPLDLTYRVAFELSKGSSPATAVDTGLDSVARFLNMQARAGVPVGQLKLAVVVHGGATFDLLKNDAYRERTGENNPNIALIEELSKAGVQIIVCGQSAASRGLTKDMFLEPVNVALSAMTAFAVLQERGYHVNPF